MASSFTKICGGNVPPSRFVKVQSDNTVIICAASTDNIWGISQPSTRRAPLSGWDDGYAGISGEPINIYGPGDDAAPLELGGTVTVGDAITSDGTGKGVAGTSNLNKIGAIAQRSGQSGDIIPVKPMRYDVSS